MTISRRVVLAPSTWTRIDGEMVSGGKYRLINGYANNVLAIAESASTPTNTTNAYPLAGLKEVTWKYDGTPLWAIARVVDQEATLGVDIFDVSES